MDAPLPPLARWLGLAGLIPFLVLAFATAFGVAAAGPALAAYGATILAFLGAVHWGLALAGPPGARGEAGRLLLGVVPQLVGWGALLLPVAAALGVLAAALLATAAVETLASRSGLLPAAYLRLRWVLSSGAAACLLLAMAWG